MASYHFSAQIIGRAKGRSAIAAAAYRAAARLRDEATGDEHDFSRRRGVVHSEILLPEGAAPWLADRQALWNHVHHLEIRRDAQLARELNLALPHELSDDARLTLVREFVRAQFSSRGMVADLAIHAPTDNDPRNHHAHVMLTLRKATSQGLYRVKTREWNSDALLKEWRAAWADAQNRALARDQHQDRVDHRTLVEQQADARRRGDRVQMIALDREPEIHVGPRAQQAGRRGHQARSKTHAHSSARPRDGAWRSSRDATKRQRTVDYARVDRGSRPAFNAARAAETADRLTRRLTRLQHREARLRLIELRLYRGLLEAREQWAAHRQALPRHKDGLARYAAREAHLMGRLQHFRRRQGLLAQLLRRTDRILAELFLTHERVLGRGRVLGERTRPLSLLPTMTPRREPGRRRGRGPFDQATDA